MSSLELADLAFAWTKVALLLFVGVAVIKVLGALRAWVVAKAWRVVRSQP